MHCRRFPGDVQHFSKAVFLHLYLLIPKSLQLKFFYRSRHLFVCWCRKVSMPHAKETKAPTHRPIAGLLLRMGSTTGAFEPPKGAGKFAAAPPLPPGFSPPIAAACDCTDAASGMAACLEASYGEKRAKTLAQWALAHVVGGSRCAKPGGMTFEQAATVALFTLAEPGDDDVDAQLAAAAEAAAQSNFEDGSGAGGVGSVAERVNTWMAHRAAFGRDACEDDRWLGFAAHFAAALRLLPAHPPGAVFRGVHHAKRASVLRAYAPGARVIWAGFASATASVEKARAATRGVGTLFAIEAKSVRQLGSLAAIDEDELVFEANSEFVVKSVTDSGASGVIVVDLLQAESRTPLLGSGPVGAASSARGRHKHRHHHHKKSSSGMVTASLDGDGGGGGGGGPDTSPVRIRSRTRSGEDVTKTTTMSLTQITLAPASMPAAASPVAAAVTVTTRVTHKFRGVEPTSPVSSSSPSPSPRPTLVISPGLSTSTTPRSPSTLSQPRSPKRPAATSSTVSLWSAARSYVLIRSPRFRSSSKGHLMAPLHPAWSLPGHRPTKTPRQLHPQAMIAATQSPRMPQVSATPGHSSTPSTPRRSPRRKISPADMQLQSISLSQHQNFFYT